MQLSAKIDKLEMSNRKMKHAINKKKRKRTVTIQTHPEMMGQVVLGIYLVDMNVINKHFSITLVQ